MLGETEVFGLRAGDRLGRYELLCVIGRGGFALVWLARLRGSRGFEKLVAVKTIRPELAHDGAFEKMFVDEARIAAAIEHPNVARVVDFGDERGVLYLVMEYVGGDPLSSIKRAASKRDSPFPVEIAVSIIADTCAGLHAAHELRVGGQALGVIHRDVSPQNILVSESGIPKLVDFGIAKATDRLAADTAQGFHKGKVRYMAPEQVTPRAPIDRRVDVWAAAAVFYELVEGRPILEGPNDVARLHALIAGHPIAPFSEGVPPAIAAVVFRGLAHDPNARWSTALEMREALLDALSRSGRRISTSDVEAFYRAVRPGRRDEHDALVRGALAEAEARALTGASGPLPDATPVAPSEGTLGSAVTRDETAMPPSTRPHSRAWRWIPALAVAGVGIALVGARRPITADATPSIPSLAASSFEGNTTPAPPATDAGELDAPVAAASAPPSQAASTAGLSGSGKGARPARPTRPASPRPHTPPNGTTPSRPRVDDQIQ